MATENVLKQAVKQLQLNTQQLQNKLKLMGGSKTKEGKEISKQITRNNSMILDYQYRINHKLK